MNKAETKIDLTNPELYINRELSLLEFNRRVLEQAKDEATPLLERLRFLCISNRNLDEFFEIRTAGLKQQIEFGSLVPSGADKMAPTENLACLSQVAHEIVEEQYRVFNEVLIPMLQEEGIRFLKRDKWSSKMVEWVRRHFTNEVLPVLTPIGLDPSHPFPRVLNKALNFIVVLEGKDAFGRASGLAVVQAPRSLPRLLHVPESNAGSANDFVFLSSIIHAHVGELFPGMKVAGCYQFRITRNSDLFVDEEEIDDLMHAIQGELGSRRYGDAVRLEVADNTPDKVVNYLLQKFSLQHDDLYRVKGPVNLNRLIELPDLIQRPDLSYPPFTPSIPAALERESNIFEALKKEDILLHHPFESFNPVVELVRQAAADPDVLAIKQTLYRSGPDSPLVNALVDAARNGKEVTVVVELRARFDEEANIKLATRFQEVGAHVVYGVVGHKTHGKLLLVVRKEKRKLKRYAHLGTGNYHAKTARLYTDLGLMTADKDVCEDVHKLFQQLTGLGKATRLKKLLQSPFTLHKTIIDFIQREAANARADKPARIIVKMNSLVEPQVIKALYEASQAGVKIDLIVRGICALRPGIAGVSENIRVRSIVGRFLEHTRIFYFLNDGDSQLFGSSADWMNRNFFRRVEAAFPILDVKLRERVFQEGLNVYINDNVQAWLLQSDGSYKRARQGNQKPRVAQQILLEELSVLG